MPRPFSLCSFAAARRACAHMVLRAPRQAWPCKSFFANSVGSIRLRGCRNSARPDDLLTVRGRWRHSARQTVIWSIDLSLSAPTKTPDQLLAEADEAERMAAVVSYRKDKEALLRRAEELRRAAAEADPRKD